MKTTQDGQSIADYTEAITKFPQLAAIYPLIDFMRDLEQNRDRAEAIFRHLLKSALPQLKDIPIEGLRSYAQVAICVITREHLRNDQPDAYTYSSRMESFRSFIMQATNVLEHSFELAPLVYHLGVVLLITKYQYPGPRIETIRQTCHDILEQIRQNKEAPGYIHTLLMELNPGEYMYRDYASLRSMYDMVGIALKD